MEENQSYLNVTLPEARQAHWENFERTGSIRDYLLFLGRDLPVEAVDALS